MKLLLSVIVLFLYSLHCTPPPKLLIRGEATISVINEKLCLSPLLNESELFRMSEWPKDLAQQNILLRRLATLRNKLLREFHRCEKFGMYTIVDDAHGPTVRISITLLPHEIINDTLQLPIRLQAERISNGQQYIYTLPTFTKMPSIRKNKSNIKFMVEVLQNFTDIFPHLQLVSFFYPHLENSFP